MNLIPCVAIGGLPTGEELIELKKQLYGFYLQVYEIKERDQGYRLLNIEDFVIFFIGYFGHLGISYPVIKPRVSTIHGVEMVSRFYFCIHPEKRLEFLCADCMYLWHKGMDNIKDGELIIAFDIM